MNKICIKCGSEYVDTTKRKVGKTCTKQCAYALMAATRKEKGSYKRTKNQNEKMIISLQKARESGKWKISDTAKEKLSKKMKAYYSDPEYLDKAKQTYLKKYGVEHHMKSATYRAAVSKLHKGKTVSIETRKKLSANSARQKHRFSRCRGGFREDLEQYFRSSWEANYARYLKHKNISYEYEPEIFQLDEAMTYTPDFKLEDGTYVEIKGWLTEKYSKKIKLFTEKYNNVRLIIITRYEYKKLYNEYSNVIPNWEKVTT